MGVPHALCGLRYVSCVCVRTQTGANLPGDWALYASPVPRIRPRAGLANSFALGLPRLRQINPPEADKLQTVPRDNALAFG